MSQKQVGKWVQKVVSLSIFVKATAEAVSGCMSVLPPPDSQSPTLLSRKSLASSSKFHPAVQTSPLSIPSLTSSHCFTLNAFN